MIISLFLVSAQEERNMPVKKKKMTDKIGICRMIMIKDEIYSGAVHSQEEIFRSMLDFTFRSNQYT